MRGGIFLYMYTTQYLAGFIDGEGSIGIYRKKQRNKSGRCLEVQISQTQTIETRLVLNKLKEKYGGCITDKHCYGNQRPWIRYKASSLRALQLIRDIYPYLIIKKNQAKVAIEYYEKKISPDRAESELKRLKSV